MTVPAKTVVEYIVLTEQPGFDEFAARIESLVSDIYKESNTSSIEFIKTHCKCVKDLVIYLSLKNRYPNTNDYTELNQYETELNHPILLLIDQDHYNTLASTKLNKFSIESLQKLISSQFHHLNVIQIVFKSLQDIEIPGSKLTSTQVLMNARSTRVLSWIGLGCKGFSADESAINSMVDDLGIAADLENYEPLEALIEEIDYRALLDLKHPRSHYIGHIYQWGFKSHLLDYDELLYCAKLMLEIAVENCGDTFQVISKNRLLAFAFNVRDNYRMGNQFHNFRHAVDVLQATFYLLVQLNCIPGKKVDASGEVSIAKYLLPPGISFTLLIASFGHDIGHPGLTNKFLVDHRTPIAKHFNDISVLESFHYAEFKSILDKFFPKAFSQIPSSEAIIRKSILSTDMINHFAYIERIDDFMKFQDGLGSYDDVQYEEDEFIEIRYLLCSLIIKCADISNVSRPLDISAKWGVCLTNETNEILNLESQLKDPSSVDLTKEFVHTITDLSKVTTPEIVEKLPSICTGQCFFIRNFVIMFFEKIQIILPGLKFLYEHINENVNYWESNHL